jgi:nitroreductase
MASPTRVWPDEGTIQSAMALAAWAPSVHNSQPWRWRVRARSIDLYADMTRHLPVTDPQARDLLMSCGAALHHMRVAFRALGWTATVRRLPDPTNPDQVATIDLAEHDATAEDFRLASAIPVRRTDRRRYSSWPVPEGMLTQLSGLMEDKGMALMLVTKPDLRYKLARAIAKAATFQEAIPAYQAELSTWAGAPTGTAEGVPSASIPRSPDPQAELHMRSFPGGKLPANEPEDELDASVLTVLATVSDDRLSHLRAGEALSAVLLTATTLGLTTCPLTQALEVTATRELVRTDVLAGWGHPQFIARIGWAPISAAPLPPTPRRPITETVEWDTP